MEKLSHAAIRVVSQRRKQASGSDAWHPAYSLVIEPAGPACSSKSKDTIPDTVKVRVTYAAFLRDGGQG